MSAVTSPARRVLGEKDPNTLLAQIQSPKKARLDIEFASPRSLKPRHASGSPHAGQKRKIHQVEDEEAAESQNSNALQILSHRTDILSDEEPSMHEEGFYTSMAEIKSTPNTLLTSFRASQEEHPQLEAEFVILDEPSQQTLDKMHAVSFTQTTSQLVPSLRPDLVKEPSQLSLSMSSLIDFDNNLSSQGDDMQMLEEPVQGHNSEKDTRKQMLLEKAETLRTRLQLAFFKVETNQISKPFARLQVPKARSSSPDLARSSSSSSTLRPRSVHQQANTMSPETRVAIARARATMGPKPTVRPLSSLPVPNIAPTAFSARWNDVQQSQDSQGIPAYMPSSPPLSNAGDVEIDEPINRIILEPRTPVQHSSPGGAQLGRSRVQTEVQYGRFRPGGLTSSVIKGEAANSLLQLVRGGSGGVGMCGL
ncbi:hypothetical protein PV11_07550 [Exophiala sideris]|uniref:Uncharacterized protein n=1 Tax=Exophiala sideris TaxID=1016849 RepID=A0A0D1WY12_9EURO|nr:hypothetical protein PV11_07550 [Exophiala sideris]